MAVFVERAGTPTAQQQTQEAARALSLRLVELPIRVPEDLDAALASAIPGGADALIGLPSALLPPLAPRIVAFTTQQRLPSIFAQTNFPRAGALMAYGVSISANYYRAATFVDKILKGARPADIPVERPTRYDFVVNLRTAQALGLTLPQSILIQATEVVQ